MNFAVINLDESPDRFDIVTAIIEQEIPDAPEEVKVTVAAYAQGNLGAARKIAEASKGFTDPVQVEQFMGWSLEEKRETGPQIWDRLKRQTPPHFIEKAFVDGGF